MTSQLLKNLSPFGESALTLDADFMELERLSQQLERLDIDTENGLDKGREILARFGECGTRIGDGVQALARNLETARAGAEKAAGIVAERATQVQQRNQESQRLIERFQQLGDMVKKITAAVAELKKPSTGPMSAEEKALLVQHLPELDTQLGVLSNEAEKLKEEARASKMKMLERNADSLGQSLQAARRRLSSIAGPGMSPGNGQVSPELH